MKDIVHHSNSVQRRDQYLGDNHQTNNKQNS